MCILTVYDLCTMSIAIDVDKISSSLHINKGS